MPTMKPGRHLARVTSTALGTTETGKTQIAVGLQNEAGEHITYYGYFTEAALPYTLERLEACGWDPEANNLNVCSLHDSDMLVGNEVEVTVDIEIDNDGKERPKVRWINKVGEGGGLRNKLSADEAKRVGSDLRGLIARARGPKPNRAPAAKAEAAKAPPAEDTSDYNLDDIPF